MADINHWCDVKQGFEFKSDSQAIVGHLRTLKIGDTVFETDFQVTNPEEPEGKHDTVGVLAGISWDIAQANPIAFTAYVSVKNKGVLKGLFGADLKDTSVEFTFEVFEYDPLEKKVYKCFHTDGEAVKGLIAKEGSRLMASVDPHPGYEVQSPQNYMLNMTINPATEEVQKIHLAHDMSQKQVKEWGIKTA